MLYTVGFEKVYKAQIEVWGGPLFKIGRNDEYPGGCIFQDIATAQRYINEKGGEKAHKYGVFGVNADWSADTTPSEDGWWNHLLFDKEIIVLEEAA